MQKFNHKPHGTAFNSSLNIFYIVQLIIEILEY